MAKEETVDHSTLHPSIDTEFNQRQYGWGIRNAQAISSKTIKKVGNTTQRIGHYVEEKDRQLTQKGIQIPKLKETGKQLQRSGKAAKVASQAIGGKSLTALGKGRVTASFHVGIALVWTSVFTLFASVFGALALIFLAAAAAAEASFIGQIVIAGSNLIGYFFDWPEVDLWKFFGIMYIFQLFLVGCMYAGVYFQFKFAKLHPLDGNGASFKKIGFILGLLFSILPGGPYFLPFIIPWIISIEAFPN